MLPATVGMDEVDRMDQLDRAFLSCNRDHLHQQLSAYEERIRQQSQDAVGAFKQSVQHLKTMPWQQRVELIAQFGMDWVLHASFCKIGKLLTGNARTQFFTLYRRTKEVFDAEKAALAAGYATGPITKQGQEIFTIAKLYVDKGADFAKEVLNRLTQHPELVEVEGGNGAIMHLMGDVEREAAPAAAASAAARRAESSVGGAATQGVEQTAAQSAAKAFEERIFRMPYTERVAAVKTEAERIAEARGWDKMRQISRRNNNRIVYKDKETSRLYSVDTQHGRFEVLDEQGKHLGEVDFDLNPTKGPDRTGGHDLNMR